jgi:hypothetical protein
VSGVRHHPAFDLGMPQVELLLPHLLSTAGLAPGRQTQPRLARQVRQVGTRTWPDVPQAPLAQLANLPDSDRAAVASLGLLVAKCAVPLQGMHQVEIAKEAAPGEGGAASF